MKLTTALIVLLLIILSACSDDSPTIVSPVIESPGVTLIAINGNNSVTLAWGIAPVLPIIVPTEIADSPTPPASSPKELYLFRDRKSDVAISGSNLIAIVPDTASHFTDSGVINGNTYHYKLVSVTTLPGGVKRYGEPTNVAMATPYDVNAVSTITFSQHIQPIFTSSCAYSGCHAGGESDGHDHSTLAALRKITHSSSNFDVSSWETMMKGSNHGAVVIPFKSTKSHLFFHINSDTLLGPISTPHMPFTGVNLPTEQVQLIKRWIDEGAQNDVGAVAFSVYPEGRILVTNQAEDAVAIVDKKTLLVSRYIRAGAANVFTEPIKAPHNLIVDQERDCYYVNLISGGNVIKYRLSDNLKLGVVTGINSPTQIALTVSGDTGFSAQFSAGAQSIRMFNTKTMQLYPEQISSPLLNKPHGVRFTPDHSELWVTGNFSDNVMVVNMSDLSTTIIPLIPNDSLPPGTGGRLLPYQTTMTSDGRYVYVSCQKTVSQQGEVRVIDRDSMKVTKIITVGKWPLILDITPDDRFVYVANRNSNDVSVIRTSDNAVVATVFNVGPQPHGIDISADGKYAYVSCENVSDPVPPHHPTAGSKVPGFLSVINLTTNTVVKRIEMGAFAAGVAVVE